WPIDCHRRLVGTSVLRAAERQHVSVNVAEWPGTPPARVARRVDPATLRVLQSDARSVLLPSKTSLDDLARGWYSMLHTICGSERVNVAIGPARWHAGGWRTPLLSDP